MEKGPSQRRASRFRTSRNCFKTGVGLLQGMSEIPNELAEGHPVPTTFKECTKVVIADFHGLPAMSTFADNTFHVLLPLVREIKLRY